MTQNSVAIVATVFNEYGGMPAWCEALERQTKQPEQVIIVDGGSTDGTWEYLEGRDWKLPVRLIRMDGASISKGRNRAIDESTSDLVAVTDAGTVAEREWLERLVEVFDGPDVDVVAGFFRPSGASIWSRSLGAATLPRIEEVDESRFQPSSRSVAIRRSWFELGFAYPEWLDYCEDLVLDLSLRRAGARFTLARDATVTYVPRPTWRAHFKQYFQYARGDGKGGLFGRRHFVRYATYIGLLGVLMRRRPPEVALAALFGLAYVGRPIVRLLKIDREEVVPYRSTALELVLIPVHRLVGDVAKMVGYPVGLLWRGKRFGRRAIRTSWERIPPR